MGGALILGLLAGLDNLQAGAALGLGGLPARRRRALAAGFAVCEFGMVLLGAWLGARVLGAAGELGETAAAALLIALGAVLLWRLYRTRAADVYAGLPLGVLPVMLSFDNLAVGAALAATPATLALNAVLAGIVSGGLALLGMVAGNRLAGHWPRVAAGFGGVWLIALGVFGAA